LLRVYQECHPQGSALNHTLPEQTLSTSANRRRADRAIWTGFEKLPNLRRTLPTVAIEFVSESRRVQRRNYEIKRDEYLASGILEYWVIDRYRRCMTVFRKRTPVFDTIVIQETDSYTTPLLPGFELPLSKLLAEADAVADDSDDE
jgi:Uma2 family endonuclease